MVSSALPPAAYKSRRASGPPDHRWSRLWGLPSGPVGRRSRHRLGHRGILSRQPL